jgi:hypothetical protein
MALDRGPALPCSAASLPRSALAPTVLYCAFMRSGASCIFSFHRLARALGARDGRLINTY